MSEYDPNAIAKRMKQEVWEDMLSSVVPFTVTSFSELHDHVDANGYGGLFELADAELGEHGHLSDRFIDAANAAMDITDLWLRNRKPDEAP